MKTHSMILIAILFAALGAGAGFFWNQSSLTDNERPAIQGLLWPNPKTLKAFQLTDDEGNSFTEQQLQGQWSFLFFGFTHCPDICPNTLALLNQVEQQLALSLPEVKRQVIFVTVDPDRDSVEQMHEYVSYFNPDFTALTGSEAELGALSRQLGILSMRVEDTTTDEGYLMDHSASILLIDPRGRLVGIFSTPHDIDDISQRFEQMQAFISSRG